MHRVACVSPELGAAYGQRISMPTARADGGVPGDLIRELACVDAVFEVPRSARHLEHGVFPTDLSSGHDIHHGRPKASLGRIGHRL